jgi:hypothetical protein
MKPMMPPPRQQKLYNLDCTVSMVVEPNPINDLPWTQEVSFNTPIAPIQQDSPTTSSGYDDIEAAIPHSIEPRRMTVEANREPGSGP